MCLSRHLRRSSRRERRGGGECLVQLWLPPPPLPFAPRFFFYPHTRPWGAGPPAGTSSPIGPVSTSCRLPGRGLRGRRVSRPLAWCPGLTARSPCWRGAPLAPTDSETERRCLAAPRQRAIGRPGSGRGRPGGDVGDSEPWKSSRFVQVPPGKARCEAEQRVPLLRQQDLGGEGWWPRAAVGRLSPSPSYYVYG